MQLDQLKRREFITLLGGAAAVWPLAACAQQPKMLRLDFVGIQPRDAPIYTNFLRRMAQLGYQEGRNFTFDYIQTPNVEGYEKTFHALAARKVDLFLAVGNEPALRAAIAAAGGKPIAFLAIDFDPQAKGYVASLSRPGGNVTGLFVCQIELAAKRVEIVREAFPRASTLGIVFDTTTREQRDAAAEAARKFALEPRMIEVRGEEDYAGAFAAMDDARGQPIIVPAGAIFLRDRAAIAQALLERRIPSIAAFRENLQAGAVISYGYDLMGLFYDIAGYVHQIARGAKPADMPIEHSPRFYMAVNLQTAAHGLDRGQTLPFRAGRLRIDRRESRRARGGFGSCRARCHHLRACAALARASGRHPHDPAHWHVRRHGGGGARGIARPPRRQYHWHQSLVSRARRQTPGDSHRGGARRAADRGDGGLQEHAAIPP